MWYLYCDSAYRDGVTYRYSVILIDIWCNTAWRDQVTDTKGVILQREGVDAIMHLRNMMSIYARTAHLTGTRGIILQEGGGGKIDTIIRLVGMIIIHRRRAPLSETRGIILREGGVVMTNLIITPSEMIVMSITKDSLIITMMTLYHWIIMGIIRMSHWRESSSSQNTWATVAGALVTRAIVHVTHVWNTDGDFRGNTICQEDTMVPWWSWLTILIMMLSMGPHHHRMRRWVRGEKILMLILRPPDMNLDGKQVGLAGIQPLRVWVLKRFHWEIIQQLLFSIHLTRARVHSMMCSGSIDSTNTLNHGAINGILGMMMIPWWRWNSAGLIHLPLLPSIWGMTIRPSVLSVYLNLDLIHMCTHKKDMGVMEMKEQMAWRCESNTSVSFLHFDSSLWMSYGTDWGSGAGEKRKIRGVRIRQKAELALIEELLQMKPLRMRRLATVSKCAPERMFYTSIPVERKNFVDREHQWRQ